jgi:DNA-binding PadR family transcriptional regulator
MRRGATDLGPIVVAVAIQHAVLSFLADGPSYGYEIKSNFEKAVGPQWGGLNIGHVYQILERLSRDGLVTSRTVSQDVRPDRTVYRVTAAGRRELESWLGEPSTRTAGYRDDFILKVLAAGRRSEEQVHQVCRTQRDARMAELQTLRALRRQHKDEPLAALTIEAAILGVQADLKLIEVADANAARPLLAATASERSSVKPAEARRASGH